MQTKSRRLRAEGKACNPGNPQGTVDEGTLRVGDKKQVRSVWMRISDFGMRLMLHTVVPDEQPLLLLLLLTPAVTGQRKLAGIVAP